MKAACFLSGERLRRRRRRPRHGHRARPVPPRPPAAAAPASDGALRALDVALPAPAAWTVIDLPVVRELNVLERQVPAL